MKKMCCVLVLILASLCCVVAEGNHEKSTFPSKTIEIIAPAAPGGGWDSTARAIQKTIKEENLAPGINIIVINKSGGNGSVGWTYLQSKGGDGHYVAMSSSLLYLNDLLGRSKLTTADFTPIATLTNEWIATAVKKDSEFKTASDLIAKLKKDPASVKIGVAPALGNDDHLALAAIAQAAGVDPRDLNYIVFKTSELIPNLLGGFVDIIQTGFADMTEYYKSGDARILAISGDERYPAPFDGIPTWKESGADLSFPHWRGVIGPADMSADAIAWWDDILKKVLVSETWKSISKNNGWEPFVKNQEETAAMYKEQYGLYSDLVETLGLKK